MAKLGIDVDGVLAEFDKNFVKVLSHIGCEIVFPLDSPEFPDVWCWPEKWGATDAQIRAAWEYVKQSNNFWYELLTKPNTHHDISALRVAENRGHSIYFITNRPGDSAKRQTEDWLLARGWPLPTVLVTIEGTKHLAAEALGLDAYIDDNLANLEGHPEGTRLFLLDRPLNRHVDSSRYTRVHTVKEMLEKLGVLS